MKICEHLAGLVVCANDGLDVDLLVSRSLVGWEEESDLCVKCLNVIQQRQRQRQSHSYPAKTKTGTQLFLRSLFDWQEKCVNLIIQDEPKGKDRHMERGNDRDTYTERHKDKRKNLPTCFWPTQGRRLQ